MSEASPNLPDLPDLADSEPNLPDLVDASDDEPNLPDLLSLSREERIELALDAVRSSGTNPDGTHILSLRRAAEIYGLARTTLTNRYNGSLSRVDAHTQEMKLSPSQESALVDWIKSVGQRGVPLNPQAVRDHAADISGQEIGESWIIRFMARHPDLKVRWTTSLEACCSNALNRPLVNEYFDILEKIVQDFHIQPGDIYNMDEKGIQLGVGKRIGVLVDRDQKKVYQVESGNRELVTIIETVCADGTALRPSIIFQGMRRNFEWGRNNPCDASISHSAKGWTDQDLGSLWLERDFEPQTAKKLVYPGPRTFRLLILDGHNSHCTYRFCKFAAEKSIIVLCLPSHTTHALQPCDVGVFAPLSSAWKSQVVKAAVEYIPITKYNLLENYHKARVQAFKTETILSSFKKTGIYPLDRNAIDEDAFKPALNTTTKSAQPVPAARPSLLIPVFHPQISEGSDLPPPSEAGTTSTSTTTTSSTTALTTLSSTSSVDAETPSVHYELVGLPPILPRSATRDELRNKNWTLRKLLMSAKAQIEGDYAKMKLMDKENERLHVLAFTKTSKPKSKLSSSHPRHMTADESLDALARADFKANLKVVLQEAAVIFKRRRKAIALAERELVAAVRAQARALEREQKAAEREEAAAALREQKEQEKIAKQVERDRKAAEKAAEMLKKKAERAKKAAEKAEEAAQKKQEREGRAAERQRKADKKQAEHERKAEERAQRVTRRRGL